MSRNRIVAPARQATQLVGIGSLESIPGLFKSLKIRAQWLQVFFERDIRWRLATGGGGISSLFSEGVRQCTLHFTCFVQVPFLSLYELRDVLCDRWKSMD
jgi:hypothetical protein